MFPSVSLNLGQGRLALPPGNKRYGRETKLNNSWKLVAPEAAQLLSLRSPMAQGCAPRGAEVHCREEELLHLLSAHNAAHCLYRRLAGNIP